MSIATLLPAAHINAARQGTGPKQGGLQNPVKRLVQGYMIYIDIWYAKNRSHEVESSEE